MKITLQCCCSPRRRNWYVSNAEPPLELCARSLAAIRRLARKALGDDAEIALELRPAPDRLRAAFEIREAAHRRAEEAARAAAEATRSVIRTLILEPPFLSLRDVGEMLGISHQAVKLLVPNVTQWIRLRARDEDKWRRENREWLLEKERAAAPVSPLVRHYSRPLDWKTGPGRFFLEPRGMSRPRPARASEACGNALEAAAE